MNGLLLTIIWSATAVLVKGSYSNVTLSSLGGDLKVTVYLPAGIKDDEPAYYESTRFDHGSMIGSISRVSRFVTNSGREKSETHELYGTELWRIPHNAHWPESGVGFAAEFGVGDNGPNCDYRCGWYGIDDVTNGLLGYKEALPGQSFLKIGVGELIKSSCDECDSSMDYRFNSPYQYAKPPTWTLKYSSDQQVIMEHEARLNHYGYHLEKTITLADNTLSVTSTLTNLGRDAFSTSWYSHNFFTCDGVPIGPGYGVDLGLKESKSPMFEEPGLMFGWSRPLRDYARVKSSPESNLVSVTLDRPIEPGTRIKAEFHRDQQSTGAFTLRGCGSVIDVDFPELVEPEPQQPNPPSGISMYAFNLYMERGALCPEPQLFIHLDPGASTSWTQRVVMTDEDDEEVSLEGMADPSAQLEQFELKTIVSETTNMMARRLNHVGGAVLLALAVCSVLYVASGWIVSTQRSGQYRAQYSPIPDSEEP
jgi:hypothetical protein